MPAWKDSVRAATTGNLSPFPPTTVLTIDGVALKAGDRVLVKDQTNASQNGVWVVASNGPWARAADSNTNALVTPEMVVRVSEGNLNGHSEWALHTHGPIALGTTGLTYARTNPLEVDQFGEVGFSGWSMADADIFVFSNRLQDGQSDNPNAYLAASLAGYGGICTGVHGRNGNGSPVQPNVGTGIYGDSDNGYGVYGSSVNNIGVEGASSSGEGVLGQGKNGVHGVSSSKTDSGVWGENRGAGYGVSGSTTSDFQLGPNVTAGVWGNNASSGPGVKGTSISGDGVLGFSSANNHAGVSAMNNTGGPTAYGLWAQGSPAGHFQGDVEVTGDVRLLNADIAEKFDAGEGAVGQPGSVMVLDDAGTLRPSCRPYDRRVVGVVSGAGCFKSGLILDNNESRTPRVEIALVGKVFCRVDASAATIEVGDLLTTSHVPGHAMKADDPVKAFGAVIGKAMGSLRTGQGLIPVLVALQ